MVSTAKMLNVSRIVVGGGIAHPFGNPQLSFGEEKELRMKLVMKAFQALKSKVEKSTVFS